MDNFREAEMDDLIESQIAALKETEAGTAAYAATAKALADLYKARVDEIDKSDRLDLESRKHNSEVMLKEAEQATDRKFRRLKVLTDTLGIAVPAALYGLCYWTGLEFEKTGLVKSFFSKQNLSQLFRLKR